MSHTPRHPSSETSIHKESFFDSFDANSIVDWLAQYGKNLIYALIVLVAILVAIYRMSSSSTSKSEKDYLQASTDFSAFLRDNPTNGEAVTQEAFQRLTALINSHPELHAAYDGAIAQTLLNRGQAAEAKPLITNTLKRTKTEDLIQYNDFATATLLISEEHYTEALQSAQNLHQSMLTDFDKSSSSERKFGEILFAFNLLRIALLQQQLGNAKAELQTWQEWKRYAGLDKAAPQTAGINPIAFRVIIQQLATGSIALPDYIAYRENALK